MATKLISPKTKSFARELIVTRSVVVRRVAHEVQVKAEFIDRLACDPEDIAETCMDPTGVRMAIEARALAESEKPAPPETAIYIVSPEGYPNICKIGVAAKRLPMLQCGCWAELSVKGLFWVVEGSAFGVEKLSHRIADKMGKRLKGEWVEMDAAGAGYVVASVIHSVERVKVCDSWMWLRHRAEVMRERALLQRSVEESDGPTLGYRRANLEGATVTSGVAEPAATLRR
jgi:hypothetical protein